MRYLHKFGGSSLSNNQCYYRVTNIIKKYTQPGDIIIVSASGKTTNKLIDWIESKKNKSKCSSHSKKLDLYQYQKNLIKNTLSEQQSKLLLDQLSKDFDKLEHLLNSDIITENIYSEVVCHGELWSAKLMSSVLNENKISSSFIDSRDFLRAEHAIQPEIDVGSSLNLFKPILEKYLSKRLIITGFICRNKNEETVLLGRNGSDYSATQIGILAQVKSITLWSDVAGIYTADPKKVKNAFLVPIISLDEAHELARLGASVLHIRTLQPIAEHNTDLKLRCSYNPIAGLTCIKKITLLQRKARVITSHENVCIIDAIIHENKAFDVEYQNLMFFIKKNQLFPLVKKISPDQKLIQFFYVSEIATNILKILKNANLHNIDFKIHYGFSLIAMVGKDVSFSMLYNYYFQESIKNSLIEVFYQNNTGISIVAILKTKNTRNIVNKLHQFLFFKKKRIGLILFGIGNIGKAWLELFSKEYKSIMLNSNYECILSGIVNSQKSLLNYHGFNLNDIFSIFKNEACIYNKKYLMQWMFQHPFDELVVLDITSSTSVAKQYSIFAENKIHVISANKIAGSSDIKTYKKIRNAFSKNNCHWLYNATVGAGLPINYIIRDLNNCGDEILSISGIFSGTLSWLFLNFDGKIKFTELVKQAWKKGLTEPDPRIDLSGQDVMRKLIILMREAGYELDPKKILLNSLISNTCKNTSINDFFEKNKKLNDYMDHCLKKAHKKKLILRYVATFDAKKNTAYIGIKEIKKEHILASLLPGDNIFCIKSNWYKSNPLVIKGPGAGKEVTSGAIQSDINQLIELL